MDLHWVSTMADSSTQVYETMHMLKGMARSQMLMLVYRHRHNLKARANRHYGAALLSGISSTQCRLAGIVVVSIIILPPSRRPA